MGLFRKKGNPFWWYSVQYGRRRIRKSTGVMDKKKALEIYHLKRSAFIFEREKDKPGPLKLGKLMRAFLDDYSKTNKESYETDRIRIKHLDDFFGDLDASEISTRLIERYKSHRKGTVRHGKRTSGATINRELATLKTIFNKGLEWELVKENPVTRVKFFNEQNRGRTRFLSKEEKERLLAVCPPYLRRVVITALKSGMRKGNILGLKWSSVDFKTNHLIVRRTKSGRMITVTIHPDLLDVLKSLPRRSEYVFTDESGKRFSRHGKLRTDFEAAVEAAGIRDFHFHDLRHTFASELTMAGVDLKTVSELLGHSTTRMTERYSHLSPSHKGAAIHLLKREKKSGLAKPRVLKELEQGGKDGKKVSP